VLWFGLAVLAFGIAPSVPPYLPMAAGLLVAAALVYLLPRWASHPGFQSGHTFALAFGATLGSMMAGFLRFWGGPSKDLYFKIVVNVIAVFLLIMLRWTIRRRDNDVSTELSRHVA
jgi:membrane protein implicated in regulation of membrane protease activity